MYFKYNKKQICFGFHFGRIKWPLKYKYHKYSTGGIHINLWKFFLSIS